MPTQGLNNTSLTAKYKYPINFTKSGERFELSLHYNKSNSFLCVNIVKICQFKVKDLEIKPYLLCYGNILKDFTLNNIKKNRFKR